MSTKVLYIQSKQRPDPLSIVKLQDFDCIEGENINPKIIIESPNISLSEPDVFSQIVGLRNPDGSNDAEIARLLKICIYLLSKPTLKGKQSCFVLKLRSFCIELGDLIYQVFPDSQVLFLYRNAEDVVRSSIRAFVYLSAMLPTIAQNIDLYSRFIPLLKEYANDIDFTDSTAIDIYTMAWLSVMQRYRFLQQRGIPTCTIRYENLVADPQKIVSAIFEYCGLSLAEVSQSCQVFAKDSQSGSNLSKENLSKHEIQMPDILEIRQKMDKLLQKHPEIKTPNFFVSDTL